jgi:hypothetical protein
LSSHYTPGSGNGASSNSNTDSFASRREFRANNITGMLPPLGTTGMERSYGGTFVFEHDRQTASQSDATRCGICYLHFPVSELVYREEGFYLCEGCNHALGKQVAPMLRRQQKLG